MITATTTTTSPSPSPMYHEVVSAPISNLIPLQYASRPTFLTVQPANPSSGIDDQSFARFSENSLIIPSVTAAITPSPICAALPVTLIVE